MSTDVGSCWEYNGGAERNKDAAIQQERSKSPAGHGSTGMVERETMIDKHPKIGRVSQSGAFFC